MQALSPVRRVSSISESVRTFVCVTPFYSHVNFTVYPSGSSIYTEGREAQWTWECRGHDLWSTQTLSILLLVPCAFPTHLCALFLLVRTCNSSGTTTPGPRETLGPTVCPNLQRMGNA